MSNSSPLADWTLDGRPRLLTIDDDPDIGVVIQHVAEDAGYQAKATTEFGQFKAAYDDELDVIILDLHMPEFDGIEVLRFLAAGDCKSAIIVVSGFDARVQQTALQLARARGLRLLGSLTKPLSVAALSGLLSDLSPSASAAEALETAELNPEDLRRGIAAGELAAFFQPKIEMRTGRLVAVEALARWRHPTSGIIQPDAFIELAENMGLIDALTDAVMSDAFKQCSRWRAEGLDLKVSVNVSARSLERLDLPDRLAAIAAEHGLAPEHAVLEVTESWLADDVVTALDVLTRLRIKGFGLSIDDFGTGHATMQQLHRVPFSELKVDQSFVRGASRDSHARTIVQSSIELGHELQLRVVAEGVETSEEWELVKLLGCDQAQGHYIAAPMCGADLPDWLTSWESRQA